MAPVFQPTPPSQRPSELADGSCFPAYATIAKTLGISRPTAVKAVDTLISAGLIRKEERQNENGIDITNMYYLVDLSGQRFRKSQEDSLGVKILYPHGKNSLPKLESVELLKEKENPLCISPFKKGETSHQDLSLSPAEKKKRPGRQSKPRSTAPLDFAPDQSDLDFYNKMKSEGRAHFNPKGQAERFIIHHSSKGSMFSDWHQAFKNWLLNAEKFWLKDHPEHNTQQEVPRPGFTIITTAEGFKRYVRLSTGVQYTQYPIDEVVL